MHYDGMPPKQKRIVERDLETLFSLRAILKEPSIESFKRLGFFHPHIRYRNQYLFFSEQGRAALRRLRDLIYGISVLSSSVSKQDIYTQLLRSYRNWIENELQPTGQEFLDDVVNSLLSLIKNFEFLIQIEGIDIEDQDILEFGSIRIQRTDPVLLKNIKFHGNLDFESVYDQFKDSLWLIGSSKGSENIASEQFKYRVLLTIGIIAVCGAVLYKGAIWQTRVRPLISPLDHRRAVSSLRWEIGGNNPTISRIWGEEQDLPLGSDSINYLREQCFLNQLSSLPDHSDHSELQRAIIRSLYWFADAYRDRILTMKFVKLWSCAECFFSIGDDITELNAKGIASILAFAGYGIVKPRDYASFRQRVKNLYRLRSKVLHRAKFDNVEIKDLNDLSFWIGWLIINMVSLAERGYKTLKQVFKQVSHIDELYRTEEILKGKQ